MFLTRNGLRKSGHSLDIQENSQVPQEFIYYILKITFVLDKEKGIQWKIIRKIKGKVSQG